MTSFDYEIKQYGPITRIFLGGGRGAEPLKSSLFGPKKWTFAPHPLTILQKTLFLTCFMTKSNLLTDLGGCMPHSVPLHFLVTGLQVEPTTHT